MHNCKNAEVENMVSYIPQLQLGRCLCPHPMRGYGMGCEMKALSTNRSGKSALHPSNHLPVYRTIRPSPSPSRSPSPVEASLYFIEVGEFRPSRSSCWTEKNAHMISGLGT